MRVLLKLGGTLLDQPELRRRIAGELAAAAREHPEMVIVHGGGKQMTRYLSERGVQSQFVNGLRVTSPEILDAVLKVFAGTVNHELVAALVAAGALPVGLTGIDARLTEAVPVPDLGAVGKPVKANAGLLETLTANGYLPVVACVAGDREGRIFNVNADQMAVACAAAYRADRLLFLTDVDGVRGAAGSVESRLNIADCHALIAGGVATGGMQAKLNSAIEALGQGVPRVVIAPGASEGIVARLLGAAADGIGTRIETGV